MLEPVWAEEIRSEHQDRWTSLGRPVQAATYLPRAEAVVTEFSQRMATVAPTVATAVRHSSSSRTLSPGQARGFARRTSPAFEQASSSRALIRDRTSLSSRFTRRNIESHYTKVPGVVKTVVSGSMVGNQQLSPLGLVSELTSRSPSPAGKRLHMSPCSANPTVLQRSYSAPHLEAETNYCRLRTITTRMNSENEFGLHMASVVPSTLGPRQGVSPRRSSSPSRSSRPRGRSSSPAPAAQFRMSYENECGLQMASTVPTTLVGQRSVSQPRSSSPSRPSRPHGCSSSPAPTAQFRMNSENERGLEMASTVPTTLVLRRSVSPSRSSSPSRPSRPHGCSSSPAPTAQFRMNSENECGLQMASTVPTTLVRQRSVPQPRSSSPSRPSRPPGWSSSHAPTAQVLKGSRLVAPTGTAGTIGISTKPTTVQASGGKLASCMIRAVLAAPQSAETVGKMSRSGTATPTLGHAATFGALPAPLTTTRELGKIAPTGVASAIILPPSRVAPARQCSTPTKPSKSAQNRFSATVGRHGCPAWRGRIKSGPVDAKPKRSAALLVKEPRARSLSITRCELSPTNRPSSEIEAPPASGTTERMSSDEKKDIGFVEKPVTNLQEALDRVSMSATKPDANDGPAEFFSPPSRTEGIDNESSFVAKTRQLFRQVCEHGTSCPDRQDSTHLAGYAHPFDPDYVSNCQAWGVKPEQASLHGLFTWVDADKTGKVSRKELENALPLLSQLQGEEISLSEDAWEVLDEDGNGVVNFSEFAQWAGPRLGLCLGVAHLVRNPCGVMGCPCEGYRPRPDGCASDTDDSGSDTHSNHVAAHGKGNMDEKDNKQKKENHAGKDKQDKKEHTNTKKKRKGNHWERELNTTSGRSGARLVACICGHKKKAHSCPDSSSQRLNEIPYPSYWSNRVGEVNEFVVQGAEVLPGFQAFIDFTYSDKWTRDRRMHSPDELTVPKYFRVKQVFRNENSRNWREYIVRRGEMELDRAESPATDDNVEFTNIRSSVAWASVFGPHRLSQPCNEWYLFHGTGLEVAKLICKSSFKMSMAGGHTGTLYGKGTYLTESITKADEYSQLDANGERTVLVCRALGGRVRYTDELEPNQEDLVRSCIEGPYDSVLGDRERCRGTYREFVFFDAENLYPEYAVTYVREF